MINRIVSTVARIPILLAAILLVSANDPADDLTGLQGTWIAVSNVASGRAGFEQNLTLVFMENKCISTMDIIRDGTIKIDDRRQIKTIDRTDIDQGRIGLTTFGIYEVDGDTYRECYTGRKERPTEFVSRPGTMLDVWKRIHAAQNRTSELDGTWKLVRRVINGKEMGEDYTRGMTILYQNNRFTISRHYISHSVISLDQASMPKKIDWIHGDGSGSSKGMTSLGIYELEIDTLTLCTAPLAPIGLSRPTEFTSPIGSGRTLRIFKRSKGKEREIKGRGGN